MKIMKIFRRQAGGGVQRRDRFPIFPLPIVAIAALVGGFFFTLPALAEWADPAWSHRNPITINATWVPNTDQTDFPVLINRTDLEWRDATNGGNVGKANGGDILFTAADGATQLEHEVEGYDPVTGNLVAWVKVPILSSSVDTEIYIYYGNASAADQENPVGVWDDDFVGIWHLDEDPSGTAPQMKDRSPNNNHGSTEGGMLSSASVPAKVGHGLSFDGTDDLIRVLDSTSLDGTNGAATLETWIKWTNAADGDHQAVMSSSNRFDPVTPDGYEWMSQGTGDHFFYPRGDNHDNHNLGPNPFTNGIFHHLAVTMDYATRDVKIFVDGTPMSFTYEGVPTYWTGLANPADWLWGGNPDRNTRYLDGVLDEIRVSDEVRSLDWIQTSINNQGSPGTFYTVQLAESAPVYTISGIVFEDVDFAATATDYDGGIGDLALANVDVELFDVSDVYLASTSTAPDGGFNFTGLADGTFKIRARSATIGDADTLPANGLHPTVPGTWPFPLADMTWGHGSALIGGQDPTVDDTSTGDNAGPGDTWVAVTISGGNVSGVNLGFSYDLVVNENDDLNPDNVRSKQGCLRQFIKNSNAIVGVSKSWFQ